MKDAIAILEHIDRLNDRMEAAEKKAVTAFNRSQESVQKDLLRTRIYQMIVIAFIVTTLGGLSEHAAITKCFLTPAQTGWNPKVCGALFPGYNKARKQSNENIQQFQILIQKVPALDQRVTTLEQNQQQGQNK